MDKETRIISLSDAFSVKAKEATWREREPLEKGMVIHISEKMNKKEIIASIVNLYTKEGDLKKLGIKDEIRKRLEFLMEESVNSVSEQILKRGVFTIWRNGETMVVLKRMEGPSDLDFIVLKMVRSDKDVEINALLGYKTAKMLLGSDFGIPMSILQNVRLNVRDAEGIPRCIETEFCVLQERVIVAKDIFATVENERNALVNRIMIKERSHTKAQQDERVQSLSRIMTGMKAHFQEWYEALGFLGIHDKDSGYITGMDRNYGFRVPKGFVPAKGRAQDWDLNDYQELRLQRKTMIAGFDFDSFRIRPNVKFTKNCIPDVFQKEIQEYQRQLLEKILVKRA